MALTAFRAARDDFDAAGARGRAAAQRAADGALSAAHARASAAALRPLLAGAGDAATQVAAARGGRGAGGDRTTNDDDKDGAPPQRDEERTLRRAARRKHGERMRAAVADLRAAVEDGSGGAVASMTAALEAVEALCKEGQDDGSGGGAPSSAPAASAVFASLPLLALAAQLRRVRDMYLEELDVVRRGVLEGLEAELDRTLVAAGCLGEAPPQGDGDGDGEEDEEEGEEEGERLLRERLTVALAAWASRPCVDADAADRALATLADEMIGF